VHKPVEDGCDDGVTDDGAPVGQSAVGGDDGRVALLVAGVDHLEERASPPASRRPTASPLNPERTPWPAIDKVTLRFLIAEAVELARTESIETLAPWLAVHAWFEGGMAETDRAATAGGRDGPGVSFLNLLIRRIDDCKMSNP
jgi:hypothetical protein